MCEISWESFQTVSEKKKAAEPHLGVKTELKKQLKGELGNIKWVEYKNGQNILT